MAKSFEQVYVFHQKLQRIGRLRRAGTEIRQFRVSHACELPLVLIPIILKSVFAKSSAVRTVLSECTSRNGRTLSHGVHTVPAVRGKVQFDWWDFSAVSVDSVILRFSLMVLSGFVWLGLSLTWLRPNLRNTNVSNKLWINPFLISQVL